MSSESKSGVCFSAFDEKIGPVAVFSNLSRELADKVAVKSIISTLSTANRGQEIEGEAIIPFPDDQAVAFVYFTTLDSQITEGGEKRVISLNFVMPQTAVNTLYEKAAQLSEEAHILRDKIDQDFEYGKPVPGKIQDLILNWGSYDEVKRLETPEISKVGEIKEPPALEIPQLIPIIDSFETKTVANMMLAIILEVPVVLIGPDPEYLLELATRCQPLSPLRDLNISLTVPTGGQTSIKMNVPRSDIVCLTPDQDKRAFYSRDPLLFVDVRSGRIRTPNHAPQKDQIKLLERILKNTSQAEFDTSIKNFYTQLMEHLGELMENGMMKPEGSGKNPSKELGIKREELGLLIEMALIQGRIPEKSLNLYFKPKTPYKRPHRQGKNTIGFIR